jgi:DNA-binding LacI/PurR family transcriptional regulator
MSVRALAKQAGISLGEVSPALRNSRKISAEAKRRVWQRAKQMGCKQVLFVPPGLSGHFSPPP